MKSRSIWLILFVLVAGTGVAFSQDVGDQIGGGRGVAPPATRARVSAEELLKGRPVTASIDELRRILAPGHEVVVWDAAGRKTRGPVSSISEDQVVISQRAASPLLRLFVERKDRVFPAASLTRIDIVDSPLNGALIGAALAPALVFGIHRWEEASVPDSNSTKGLATVAFGGISAVVAILVGYQIDLSMNEPIYERNKGASRVTVAPWLEPTRSGVVARIRF